MKLNVILLSTVTALALAFSGAVVSAQTVPPEATTIIGLVNDARAKQGLQSLRVNDVLSQVAQNWSQQQAAQNKMSHSPDAPSLFPKGWTHTAENVATHSVNDPVAIFNSWMNSEPHRNAILNPKFTDFGTGYAKSAQGNYYATLEFAAYPAPPKPPVTSPSSAMDRHDYNGDGKVDVVVIHPSGQLLLYPGNGKGAWGKSSVMRSSGMNGYRLIAPGDFNGDGKADLVALSPAGELILYPGTGKGFAARVKVGQKLHNVTNVFSTGDYDGDGKADILATTKSGELRIYYGNGKGGIKGSATLSKGWQNYSSVFSGGDFNGDQKPDIFAIDKKGDLFAFYGLGNSRAANRVRIGSGWSSYKHVSVIGDFNGDNKTDIFAINSKTGLAYLYPGTGKGTFLPRMVIGSGWSNFPSVV